MEWYKLYFLDNRDKIVSVENLQCLDDAAAFESAFASLAERPEFPAIELWQGPRKLGKRTRAEILAH